MQPLPLFSALHSRSLAKRIRQAEYRVIYAAPGIQEEPASALAEFAKQGPSAEIVVSLDIDENTLRMGYGSTQAVDILLRAGITPTHSPGFRCGIFIVDDCGWVFTPTALYLEAEPQSEETPNAIRLTAEQMENLLVRLSIDSRMQAFEDADNRGEPSGLPDVAMEISQTPLASGAFRDIKRALEIAPPVKFDLARQVRVFEPYLQYVEIKLHGASIQRHRVELPSALQQLGASQELKDRLRTTFALIEKGSSLSSKAIEQKVAELREAFTPSLGAKFGRVMLKRHRSLLDGRIKEIQTELTALKESAKLTLQSDLDNSRALIVKYFHPIALNSPPDSLRARVMEVNADSVTGWLDRQLRDAFPSADSLMSGMSLDVQYKDVTWESLNNKEFEDALRKAFPDADWNKPFEDFQAAGEAS